MSTSYFNSALIGLIVSPLFAIAVLGHSSLGFARASAPDIVGSWLLTISPSGAAKNKALVTNLTDGSTIEVASAPLTKAPPGSTGQGTWVDAGGNTFKGTMVFLLTDKSNRFAGLLTAHTTETVSGSTMKGAAVVTLSDKKGRVVGKGTSIITGVRIGLTAP